MKCSKYRTSHYFKKFYFYPMKPTFTHTTPPPARGAALPFQPEYLAECGSDGGQVSEHVSVHVLCEQSGAAGGPRWEGDR